jgi:hypothetical protein
MIPKNSTSKTDKPLDPRLKAKQVGFGVTEHVFNRAKTGQFVNLKTGEVRPKSDFKGVKKSPLEITLTGENQQ